MSVCTVFLKYGAVLEAVDGLVGVGDLKLGAGRTEGCAEVGGDCGLLSGGEGE